MLLATTILGFRWLSARMLEGDEYLSFYTDSLPSIHRLLYVQLHFPISLDPPTYHLLSHAMMQLLGVGPIPLRLPALCGFLLFQITLFLFVRPVSGWRAALIAMMCPVMTESFFYAVQGRPYGVLLGAYGAALLCWERAGTASPRRRPWWLAGMVLACVLSITSHYFGLLVLIPVFAGELARTLQRRKLDRPMAFCLFLAAASVFLVVPFQHAAAEYRLHYYNTTVPLNIIPQSYAALFVAHHRLPLAQQHIYLVLLCLSLFILTILFCIRWRRAGALSPFFVAVAALGLLPFFGYLLGAVVTHTADVRYVLPTLFAIMVALAIAVEPLLRRNLIFSAAVLLIAFASFRAVNNITLGSRAGRQAIAARFVLSPQVAAVLDSTPGRPIYMQSLGDFFANTDLAPPELRNRFTLVYDQERELHWLNHDTNYITAKNMQRFAPLHVTSYQALLAQGDHPLVLNYRDGWDWLARDLDARHTPMRVIGKTMGGELVQLDLNPETPTQTASK